MTEFYGYPPFQAAPQPQMPMMPHPLDPVSPEMLPMMLPAEGLGQALQTSSYAPEAGITPYARGGRVQGEQSQTEKPLWRLAHALRQEGRHGDTMLAHISPEEAEILKELGGSGSINPETGLPEYFLGGLFKSIKNIVRKVIGPVGGAILGNMILPGVGGAIGGGIGGMFGHPKQRLGPLAGAGVGYFGGPAVLQGGKALLAGQGLSGALTGMQSGLGQSTGMLSNALSSLTGGLMGGNAAASGAAGAGGAGAGSSGIGSLFGGGNLLNNALLATAIGGTLMRREKPQGPQSLMEAMAQANKQPWRPDQYPDQKPFKPLYRKHKAFSSGYQPGFDPEEEAFEEDSPWQIPTRMAEGGVVGGQDDVIPALLAQDEYVIPADVVAHAGDGSSHSGAQKFDALVRHLRQHKKGSGFPPKARGLASYLTHP